MKYSSFLVLFLLLLVPSQAFAAGSCTIGGDQSSNIGLKEVEIVWNFTTDASAGTVDAASCTTTYPLSHWLDICEYDIGTTAITTTTSFTITNPLGTDVLGGAGTNAISSTQNTWTTPLGGGPYRENPAEGVQTFKIPSTGGNEKTGTVRCKFRK